MALVVEDGTAKADANSFASLEVIRAYALLRGVTLSATDSVVESQAIKAKDYLEAQRDKFQGGKLTAAQALQWPRTGVVVDGFDVAEDEIPRELVAAQCAAVMELADGTDLMPTNDGRVIIRDKTGPLETEWAPGGSNLPAMPKVDALLKPLFKNSPGFFTYRA